MKQYQSLTRRYVLFIALVIGLLVIGALAITSTSVRHGLSNLFKQRLDHTATVLDQYLRVRYLSKLSEIETVLTSPRLIAAVETGDSSTIAAEAPAYRNILNSAMFMVIDRGGAAAFSARDEDSLLVELVKKNSRNKDESIRIDYITTDKGIYEVYYNSLVTPDGLQLGNVITCDNFSSALVKDLNQLTGFDVIVSSGNEIISYNENRLVEKLFDERYALRLDSLPLNVVTEAEVGGEEILLLAVRSRFNDAIITFIASLDEHILPITRKESLLLIILAVGGGVLATGVVFVYTRRTIGRQVDDLVEAAEKIADGNLEFELKATSKDELGYLAGEFERMRSELYRARLEREKAHMEKIKSERLATIGQLTTGIIHDFKNPMAVINGTVDIIRARDRQNEKLIQYCQTINEQISRMVELTRDLLEYARGESRLEIKTVNLVDYFTQIEKFHESAYQQSGLKISIVGPEDFAVTIDPIRFRRVFDNLLNNAREALKPGDRVSINWQCKEQELLITVSDNGPGIPTEILDSLFDPFITFGKEHGTGLGLAIARKVVEDHGATIEAQSEIGRGADFLIHLPLKMVVENAILVSLA